ncbi:MAG TPA: hypothetical protein VLS47_08855 [Gallionella sp.]|nr:hypothetical protein [Gallionella sp.]
MAVYILDQVVLRAALHRLDRDRCGVGTGQHHDRHRDLAQIVSQLVQELQAIQVRQAVVEQHAVRLLRMGELQPVAAGFGFEQHEFVVRVLRQRAAASHAIHQVVLDDEHAYLLPGHLGLGHRGLGHG